MKMKIAYKIISIILCVTLVVTTMPPEALAFRPMSYRNWVESKVSKHPSLRTIKEKGQFLIPFVVVLGFFGPTKLSKAADVPTIATTTTALATSPSAQQITPLPKEQIEESLRQLNIDVVNLIRRQLDFKKAEEDHKFFTKVLIPALAKISKDKQIYVLEQIDINYWVTHPDWGGLLVAYGISQIVENLASAQIIDGEMIIGDNIGLEAWKSIKKYISPDEELTKHNLLNKIISDKIATHLFIMISDPEMNNSLRDFLVQEIGLDKLYEFAEGKFTNENFIVLHYLSSIMSKDKMLQDINILRTLVTNLGLVGLTYIINYEPMLKAIANIDIQFNPILLTKYIGKIAAIDTMKEETKNDEAIKYERMKIFQSALYFLNKSAYAKMISHERIPILLHKLFDCQDSIEEKIWLVNFTEELKSIYKSLGIPLPNGYTAWKEITYQDALIWLDVLTTTPEAEEAEYELILMDFKKSMQF